MLTLGGPHRSGPVQKRWPRRAGTVCSDGGWSMVDAHGVDRDVVEPRPDGYEAFAAERLAGLTLGEARDLTTDDQVIAGHRPPRSATVATVFLMFSMPADEFYKDVRAGQLRRAT